MFVKLLKHEWRSCRQVMNILCLVILASGATIGGSSFYLSWSADQRFAGNDNLLSVLSTLLLMGAMMAIGICSAGGVFYLIYRYYQSRFTDEGYLTFTLPVTHHQLLLASILNILRGSLCIALAAIGAIAIAGILLVIAFNQSIPWSDLAYAVRTHLPDILEVLGDAGKELSLFFFNTIFSFLGGILSLMLAVTIGSLLARKHRILCSIAVYYGLSFLKGLIFTFVAIRNVNNADATWFLTTPLIQGIATTVLAYFLIHHFTSRKLNLN